MTVIDPPELKEQPAGVCALCGRAMEASQEWCLECGAARTVIARPPDWRVPILVVAAVVLVIAGLIVFAVSRLGNTGRITVINTTAAKPASTLGSWPPGLDGYTVLLASESSEAAAQGEATKLIADHVADVGVLDVTQHPQLHAKTGPWEVYSGRYPTAALATAAADRAKRRHPRAKAVLVQRPG